MFGKRSMKTLCKIFLLLGVYLILIQLYPNWVQATEVDTLRPSVDKTTEWSVTGCTDHHDCLNDDDDATYVYTNTISMSTDAFQFDDFTSSYSTIDSVVLQIRALKYGLFGTKKVIFGRTAKDAEFSYHALCTSDAISFCYCDECPQASDTTDALGTSWANYSFSFTCDPCDSGSWTASKLKKGVGEDGYKRGWGIGNSGQDIKVAEMWLFVYYQPPAGGIHGLQPLVSKGENKKQVELGELKKMIDGQ